MGTAQKKGHLSVGLIIPGLLVLFGLAAEPVSKAQNIVRTQAKAKQAPPKAQFKASQAKAAAPAKSKLPAAPTDPKTVAVAKVDPARRDAALATAAKIDTLIEEALTRNGQKPHADANEFQLVRRMYLDVTGTIPTPQQALAYTGSKSKGRTVELVDQLLNSPGYASHQYNYWADVLRLVDRSNNNRYLRPYEDWVKDSLRKNRHFDDMVREMLSAEGRVFDNPATGYVLRDAGMPLDNLNNTVRIFLGTRIGCAQCHDHPFDKWKQKDFYRLAAFNGGLQTQKQPKLEMDIAKNEIGNQKFNQFRNVILNNNRQNVWENGKVKLRYPHDYDYPDAKPNEVVKPGVLWGSVPSDLQSMPGRVQFAGWVTSKTNPRFARTLANRLWKQVMGRGLIEPVDDMKDDTVASNEAVMRLLEEELVRLDFDTKEFVRILLNTKTYQRQVTYNEIDTARPYLFPGPVLRRMTAEQVWDSLLTLTIPNPDLVPRPDEREFQAIVMIKPGEKASDVAARAEKLPEARKSERDADNKSLYNPGDIRDERMILRRASELESPLPLGHFLREFGQSDREIIAANHTDGTVPQLLELFNGAASHMIIEDGSALGKTMAVQKTPNAVVNDIFLSILCRFPSDREKLLAYKEANVNGRVGLGNVIWALLNTREFLFIQ